MWVLDSIAKVGKMSPVQVAILLEYASTGDRPRKITEIIEVLEKRFQNLWSPKKGTIYPSVHNLTLRGYLKLHATKPMGYSLSEKGDGAVRNLISELNMQMDLFMEYFQFMIEKFLLIDEKAAMKTLRKYKEPFEKKVQELDKFLSKK